MDVPVSGGGPSREDGRFPSEPEARRKCGEGLSAQGDEGSADPYKNHPGCLRRLTPGGGGTEGEWRVAERVPVRTSKYLNNRIEQDHRRVKQRLRPVLGLKSFRTAGVVISGIELAEKIKKKQFQLSKLSNLGGPTATMPEIWQAALAA
jgi:transposase-like protein